MMLRDDEVEQTVLVETSGDGYCLTIDGDSIAMRGSLGDDGRLDAEIGARRVHAIVVTDRTRQHVFFDGHGWSITLVDPLESGSGGDEVEGGLKAPMPGKIIALIATSGAVVEKGAPLLVLEAMKMEHTITAPRKGIVKAFHYAPGDQVDEGAELVEFENA
jgi:3-methylcrotonyl-CoA carboxylase alpha subunit